ncbi:MAG: hypothetical protein CM15mP95_2220 [Alphaproteobacteria bacterium]|nr:MAG: hypothetical protein CM15mP95_2220 [Alphaproteobacteria bacterium]
MLKLLVGGMLGVLGFLCKTQILTRRKNMLMIVFLGFIGGVWETCRAVRRLPKIGATLTGKSEQRLTAALQCFDQLLLGYGWGVFRPCRGLAGRLRYHRHFRGSFIFIFPGFESQTNPDMGF